MIESLSKYAIIALLFCASIRAQTDTLLFDSEFESLLEDIQNGNENFTELLTEYLENPIDLNSAAEEELLGLPLLNRSESYRFARFVLKHRPFDNVDNFLATAPLPRSKLKLLKQFIVVEKQMNELFVFSPSLEFRSRVKLPYPQSKGEREKKYYGEAYSQYNKFLFRFNNKIKASMLTEKDRDEKYLNDFTTAALELNGLVFDKIIIGDYNYQFGQGLNLWTPYSFGKSANAVVGIIKKPKNLRLNSYSDENRYFRGVGIEKKSKYFSFSMLFSSKGINASVDSGKFKFYSSGYFRNSNELRKKHSVKELFYGGKIGFTPIENFSLKTLFSSIKYNHLLITSDGAKNRFDNLSIALEYRYGDFFYSSEWAYDFNSIASLNALYVSLSDKIKIINLYRSYPKNYFAPYARGFGENDDVNSETGYYLGGKISTPIGKLNIYTDVFDVSNSQRKSGLPVYGSEIMLYFKSKYYRRFSFDLKFFTETKGDTYKTNDLKLSIKRKKHNYRFSVYHSAGSGVKIRTRFEIVSVDLGSLKKESGLYIYEDFRFSPFKNAYVNFRFTYFRTDSYSSRLYSYENDIYGAFSVPALYGKGYRWSFLMNYKLDGLTMELKMAQTYKPEERATGSGYGGINSSSKMDFALQLRGKF